MPSEASRRTIRRLGAVVLCAAALGLAAPSARALTVFACEPEWAALARELAPQAEIVSATHARQDPHQIEARPALIAALRRADIAVCTGASLEVGWLPMLQERAGNRRVASGAPGMFFAADAVELIDIPAKVDRSMGDVHAEGNPHLHLDPERLATVAAALAARLAAIDPAGAAGYESANARWQADWASRIEGWRRRAASLAGRDVAVQHSSFQYFWRWTGIRPVADIEPKPGLPPTLGHLRQVLGQVQATPPFAVVQTLYQDPQPGQWLAERIDRPLLALPSTVTAEGPAASLHGLFDELFDRLSQAAAGASR